MTAELDILHVDNHLLVVRKNAGDPIVPDASGDASLLDRARDWVGREFHKPGAVYLGVVHRLDRPVSGTVVFARTSKAAARLTEQFRSRTVRKVYWGVSERAPSEEAGELVQWLRKDRQRNRVTAFDRAAEGAKEARTRWRVLRVVTGDSPRALCEWEPLTGRSHQLRVAARSLGATLLGDLKYGASQALEDKSIALHARRLELEHPTLKTALAFECEPPSLPVWRFP